MAQNADMPKKARPHPKPKRRPTYLQAWRKHRGYTLIGACEKLMNLREYHLTDGQLSRIERGEQPYSQDLLEALAEVYSTEVENLIMRDPLKSEAIWSIWEALSPAQREQATALVEVIKKTGTNG